MNLHPLSYSKMIGGTESRVPGSLNVCLKVQKVHRICERSAFLEMGIMNNRPASVRLDRDWKTLYIAAIHERNRNLVLQKVAAAENAMLKRGRELLHSRKIDELEVLDECLYALKAYRSAWPHIEAA